MVTSFRKQFDSMLENLQQNYINYNEFCINLLADVKESFYAIKTENPKSFEDIRKIKSEIEKDCYKILIHQQPIAHDLVIISVCVKSLYDLTRVGETALNIISILEKIDKNQQSNKEVFDTLAQSLDQCINMLDNYIQAYKTQNKELSLHIMDIDDKIDELFDRCKEKIVTLNDNHNLATQDALDLYMINKYLERCGDHIAHMAKVLKSTL